MADYAKSKGKQSQLEFVNMELAGSGGVDTYTNHVLKKRIGGLEQFKSLTDVNKATEVFEKSFERASIEAMPKRQGYDRTFY